MKKGTLTSLINELKSEMTNFPKHIFTGIWEQQQLTHLIKSVSEGLVIAVMDFSENAKCDYQREIQSAYYGKTQITLHPIVTFYKCSADQEVIRECIDIISDDTKHDGHAVAEFVKQANHHLLQTRNIKVTKLVQFTDGCSGQYKSKIPFADVSYCFKDYNFSIERHYFGSRHGKNQCDGEGGIVKSVVDKAIRSQNVLITNAQDYFNYCQKNLTKPTKKKNGECNHKRRTFLFVKQNDIKRDRLDRIVETAVKGTFKIQCIRGVEPGIVDIRYLSCSCINCINEITDQPCENKQYVDKWRRIALKMKTAVDTASTHQDINQPLILDGKSTATNHLEHLSSRPIEIGAYVAVIYDDCWYPGRVEDILPDEILKVNFMARKGSSFIWPEKKDFQEVCSKNILCLLEEPPLPINMRDHYSFSTQLTTSVDNLLINVLATLN